MSRVCDLSGKSVMTGNNVSKANNLLPVLNTFVAPIFPEPIFLMSPFLKIFVKINPKGIDPNKYEKRNTKKFSNITVY